MEKQELERISFHRERRLLTLETHCPACGVTDGQFHILGCPREECPRCGKAIITCRCTGAFSHFDLASFSVALEKTMDWQEAALGVPSGPLPWTLLETASFNRFVKPAMVEAWADDIHTDGQGGVVFDEWQLSRGLAAPPRQAVALLTCDFVNRPSPSNFWH